MIYYQWKHLFGWKITSLGCKVEQQTKQSLYLHHNRCILEIIQSKKNIMYSRMSKPQLTLAELYSMQKQKLKLRGVSFDRVLELCHRRIRTVASYGGQNTFFEIPGMIMGYPLYNVKDCMLHLVDAMRKSGFLVQILPPPHVAVMYISWNPVDVRPPVKKSPAVLEGSSRSTGLLRLF